MDLTILQWNARSLVAHQMELKNYLLSTQTRPSLVCVQETFLKPNKTIKFPGYAIERNDREGNMSGGGVATLIAEGLSYAVVEAPAGVEALSIRINLTSRKSITVTNLYHPPGKPLNSEKLQRIFETKNNIIVGDFNSHSSLWGSSTTDANSRLIEELLEEYHMTTLNTGEGTFIKPCSEGYSPLDLTIVPMDLAVRARWEVLQDSLGSDHLAVLTTFNAKPVLQDKAPPSWNFKRADWELYSSELEDLQPSQGDDVTTEQEYERLTGAILDAATKSIPKKSMNVKYKPLPYWNKECDDVIKLRNAARNRWKRHGFGLDEAENARLKEEYLRLQGLVQRKLKDTSQQHWQDYCSTLTSASKLGPVWAMARSMTGTASRSSMPHLVITSGDEEKTFETNEEKADLLAQVYAQVSSDANYDDHFARHKTRMEDTWSKEPPPPLPANEKRHRSTNQSAGMSSAWP